MSLGPLVSVAVVTYNQREYLAECLDSILSQDYENLEIVVADDASTDGTPEMLREYAARNPGKFVLQLASKNRGVTGNSNLAHFACSGKYVAWIGGDDLMLPGKIRAQVDYMESHPECSISYHNLEVFESPSNRVLGLFSTRRDRRSGGLAELVKYGAFNGACSTLVRRDRTPKNGYDERLLFASDWLYWAQTLQNGGEVRYLDAVLGRHRRHGNNVTDTKRAACYQDHLLSCSILLQDNPALHRQVRYRQSCLLEDMARFAEPSRRRLYLAASLGVKLRVSNAVRYFLGALGLQYPR